MCSPPSTGLVLQAYSNFQQQSNSSVSGANGGKNGGSSKGKNSKDSGKYVENNSNSVISVLYAKPKSDPAMERIADDLALLVVRQTEHNIDSSSSSSGKQDNSAVVSFKPFEGSIHSR